MKRALLIFMSGLLAGTVHGQMAHRSLMFSPTTAPNATLSANSDYQPARRNTAVQTTAGTPSTQATTSRHAAHRGTTGGGRWFDYVDEIFRTNSAVVDVAAAGLDIWNDTTSIQGYTGITSGSPYENQEFTSIGLSFHPFASAWNDPAIFTGSGIIGVSATDAYVIDSIEVAGWYNRNYSTPAKIAVVDTLVVTFVQGNGSGSSDLPLDSFIAGGSTAGYYGLSGPLYYLGMAHDSVNNRAGGSSVTVYKFPLHSTDTNNSNSFNGTQFPRTNRAALSLPADPTISYSVAAGNFSAVTVAFKTGDPAYPPFPGRDTVRYSDGTTILGYKYGNFRSELIYAVTASGGSTEAWPPYPGGDLTAGFYKLEGVRDGGWGGSYIPQWPWHTTSGSTPGPSSLQYPYIWFHVQCATCATIGTPSLQTGNVNKVSSVKAYPNPATNELNVSFALTQSSDVKVSLINTVGQTVATQNLGNTNSGKAVFNTSSLSAGVYMYVIDANGVRSSGRVSVAH